MFLFLWRQQYGRDHTWVNFKSDSQQGGVYVKLGQHLASLPHVLPSEYCDTMAALQDDAQYRPFDEIVRVFRYEYGEEPKDIFDEFDEKPLAAASLAQVHKAVKDGKEYAVKVQFLDLRDMASADVKTIDFICRWITFFKLRWLIREFHKNLPNELDFTNDARNATKMAMLFKDDPELAVPLHNEELTTSRILTMEFMKGVKINDIEGIKEMGFSPSKITSIINRIFNDQIFIHGFVHCDPHPGNVLIRPQPDNPSKPQVVLLDNGLYREYSQEFRVNWAHMWKSLLDMDEEKIKFYAQEVGLSKDDNHRLLASMLTSRSWDRLNEDSTQSFRTFDKQELKLIKKAMHTRAPEITQLLQTVDSSVILLLKTNDLLRYINMHLGAHPLRQFSSMMRACARSIHEDNVRHSTSIFQTIKLSIGLWKIYFATFMLNIYVWFDRFRY